MVSWGIEGNSTVVGNSTLKAKPLEIFSTTHRDVFNVISWGRGSYSLINTVLLVSNIILLAINNLLEPKFK